MSVHVSITTPPTTREEFLRLYYSDATLFQAGRLLGLTDEEMGFALLEAQFNKRALQTAKLLSRSIEEAPLRRIDENKTWCGQCDRLVRPEEFVGCQDRWCKAKAPGEASL